jgi:hypothetical protein
VWRSAIRGDVNPTWVGRRVNEHIEAGRLPGLKYFRSAYKRGYTLEAEKIVAFLADRAGLPLTEVVARWEADREEAQNAAQQPSPPPSGSNAGMTA